MDKRKSNDDILINQRLKLPDNFADELLNLEIMIEEPPIEFHVIQKLADYYAMAIQFYTSLQNKRKDIFLKKLTILFKNPNVIIAQKVHQEQLEKLKINKLPNDFQDVDSLKQTNYQLTLKNMISEAHIQRSNIHNLVTRKEQMYDEAKNLIQKDLNQQNDIIQKRIQQQKEKLQQKDFKNTELKICVQEKRDRALKMLKIYQKLIHSNMNNQKFEQNALANKRQSILLKNPKFQENNQM